MNMGGSEVVCFRLFCIFRLVVFGYFTYYPARIAVGQHVSRYVFGYYAAGADYGIVANAHAGQYTDVGSYPNVVADGYRKCILKTCGAFCNVKRMAGRIESALRGNEYIVAEFNLRTVKYDAVHIHPQIRNL